jgi:hypothetical protein
VRAGVEHDDILHVIGLCDAADDGAFKRFIWVALRGIHHSHRGLIVPHDLGAPASLPCAASSSTGARSLFMRINV